MQLDIFEGIVVPARDWHIQSKERSIWVPICGVFYQHAVSAN